MLEFITNWWGLITVAIMLIIYIVRDYEKAKFRIASKIFIAEERARELALATGEAKFNWVKNNTYHLLPKWMKILLSEEMYQELIQRVFNELKRWALNQPLPK